MEGNVVTLFDGSIQQRANAQLEPPNDDGSLTKRTQRALVLLDAVSRLKVLRDEIRTLYKLQRRIDDERGELLKESREYDE